MTNSITNITGAAVGLVRGVVGAGVSVASGLAGRVLGGGGSSTHPDVAANAGHRSPPEEDLTDDPAYEPPEELKNLKGG